MMSPSSPGAGSGFYALCAALNHMWGLSCPGGRRPDWISRQIGLAESIGADERPGGLAREPVMIQERRRVVSEVGRQN